VTGRRKRNSDSPSIISDLTDDNRSIRSAMEAVRVGLNEVLPVTDTKSHEDVVISVGEIDTSDSETIIHNSQEILVMKTQATASQRSTTVTGTNARVIKTIFEVRSKIVKLDDVTEEYLDEISLELYLEYIYDERLIHMPRKGGKWDRVLRAAEFFGIQIQTFGKEMQRLVPEHEDTTRHILACCRNLLEVRVDGI
jgi:hypothetical protein